MGKRLLLLFLLISAFRGSAQYTFEKNYYLDGYYRYNITPGAINTSDSGYYITGFCGDTNTTNDFLTYLTRIDKNGQIVWNKVSDLYTSVINGGYGLGQLVQYPDSSLILLWNDQDSQGYDFRAGYVHVDKNGNAIWGRKYTPPSNRADIYMNSLARTADNGLIGSGEFDGYFSGLTWIFFLKTDSAGNLQWCNQYFPDSVAGYSAEEGPRITATPDSGFLYTFSAVDSINSNGYTYLMKTNVQGNLQWVKRYNANMDAINFTLPQISGGDIYLAMLDTSFSSIAVLKTDMQGIPIWNYEYWSPENFACYDGTTDVNGNTILSGSTKDSLSFMFKIDSSGNILWSYKYGKPDSTLITNLLLTSDGGILGYSLGPLYLRGFPNQALIDLVKTDAWGSDGCEQPYPMTRTALPLAYSDAHVKTYPVAMTQLDTILNFNDAPMESTTLCNVTNVTATNSIKATNNDVEVYPNPANTTLNIALLSQQNQAAQLQGKAYIYIYNQMGALVLTCELVNSITTLSVGNLAQGIYHYRILDANQNLLKADNIVIVR